MRKISQKIIMVATMGIASYLIAINFMFQWWSSLLLTGLVFGFFVALYNDMGNTRRHRKLEFLIALSFLIVLVPQVGVKKTAYGDFPYPPFEIIPETKINAGILFYPKYFETERFTGFVTYGNTVITLVDTNSKETRSFNFGGDPLGQIFSYALFGDYLYVCGSYILPLAERVERFSIRRVNLLTNEIETFMKGDQFYLVFNLSESLLMSYFDQDSGNRVFELYDSDMTVVGSLDNIPDFSNIYNVYNDGEYSVLVVGQYRYDLYHQGTFVKTLASYDRSGSVQMVIFHEGRIHINSGVVAGGKYRIDSFDLLGNLDETLHYTVPTEEDFILFGEHTLIVNDGYNFDDIMLWNASSVYDQNGKPLFETDDSTGLKIYEINHVLYGYDHGLYQLEERQYSVLFRFERPQKNAVYYLSFLVVFVFIAYAEEPLWKKRIRSAASSLPNQ